MFYIQVRQYNNNAQYQVYTGPSMWWWGARLWAGRPVSKGFTRQIIAIHHNLIYSGSQGN